MEVKKNTIDSYEVITDDDGRIIKLILKCGNLTEEYPIRYDKNGNVMRIGAEWMSFMSFGGDLYVGDIVMTYTGKEFNEAVKQLVNSSYTYETLDDRITTFNFTRKNNTNATIIEKTDDGGIIGVYLTGDVLNIYTNARKIILPEDASYMFYGFNSASYLDLSICDSSQTTNMSHMFDDFAHGASKISFDLGDNFYTNKVTDMSYMFNNFANGIENNIEINLGENLSAESLKYAEYMFYGFLRYMIDDEVDVDDVYCVDTVSFTAWERYGTYFDSSRVFFDFTQYIANCLCYYDCSNPESDYTINGGDSCSPKKWNGVISSTSFSSKGHGNIYMYVKNDEYLNHYQFHGGYKTQNLNIEYPIAKIVETSNKAEDNSTVWYHKVTLKYDSRVMSNILIFETKRAMYDFINTGRIYDYNLIDTSYAPIYKKFNDEGECVYELPYYFNSNGGLTTSKPSVKSVSVDKVTINLGNFTISNISYKDKMFRTATFFYTTQENYDYLSKYWNDKQMSIFIPKNDGN